MKKSKKLVNEIIFELSKFVAIYETLNDWKYER
jgi:hypothetical protein